MTIEEFFGGAKKTGLSPREALGDGDFTVVSTPETSKTPIPPAPVNPPKTGFIDRVTNKVNETGRKYAEIIGGEGENADKSAVRRGFEGAATAATGVGEVALETLPEPARKVISAFGNDVGKILNKFIIDPVSNIPQLQKWVEAHPDAVRALEDIAGTTAAGGQIAGAILGAGEGAAKLDAVSQVAKSRISRFGSVIDDLIPPAGPSGPLGKTTVAPTWTPDESTPAKILKGVTEKVKEAGATVKRGVQNVARDTVEAGGRAYDTMALSMPEQKVIKAGIPRDITDYVKAVAGEGEEGIKRVNEMVDAAFKKETSNPRKKSLQKSPEDVAGEVFIDQYKTLDKERRRVGAQIGERAAELTKKKVTTDISEAVNKFEGILADQRVGVTVADGGKPVLDFSRSSFTDDQRAVINDLYKKMTEGGTKLTPAEIHGKDRLFSSIQREAGSKGIADLTYNASDGTGRNLYSDARDIFSSELEAIDPLFKKLNPQYRKYAEYRDQIESKILNKKDQISDKVSLDEFAQDAGISLRGMFARNKSTGSVARLAAQVDEIARELGYKGISSVEARAFADELEKIFPNTTPSNSFAGGIKTAVGSMMEGTTATKKFNQAAGALLEKGKVSQEELQAALKGFVQHIRKVPKTNK